MRHRVRRNRIKSPLPHESTRRQLARRHGLALSDVRYVESRSKKPDGSHDIDYGWEILKDGDWVRLHWTEVTF